MNKYQPYSEAAKSILRSKRPLPEGVIPPAAGFGIARASGSVCYVPKTRRYALLEAGVVKSMDNKTAKEIISVSPGRDGLER